MNDMTPGMGDNKGPAFNPEVIKDLTEKAREIADAAGEWADLKELTSKDQSEKLNDFIEGARKEHQAVEERRVDEKKPFLDAGRAIDEAFNKVKGIIKAAEEKAEPLLAAWMRKEEEEERARKAEEAQKAREAEEQAERQRKAAEARNDVVGEEEAKEAAKKAQKAQKAAQKPTKASVSSATGGGRKRSLRTRRYAEITNVSAALLHYRTNPEIADTILRLANAEIRASKGKAVEIPGIEVKEERVL